MAKFFAIFFIVLGPLHLSAGSGQKVLCSLHDSQNGFVIPFARIAVDSSITYSNEHGLFETHIGDSIHISHPLYQHLSTVLTFSDTTRTFTMERITKDDLIKSSRPLPEGFLGRFHEQMAQNDLTGIKQFETSAQTLVNIYSTFSKNDYKQKRFLRSYELIEKIKFKAPDNKYHKVLYSHFSDGDTSRVSYTPINIYNNSPYNKFINFNNTNFLNPLHPDAEDRYHYFLVDSIVDGDQTIFLVYAIPGKKSFFGIEGLYFIENSRFAVTAYSYRTLPESFLQSQTNTLYRRLGSGRYFHKDIYAQSILPRIPKNNETTYLEIDVRIAVPVIQSTNSVADKKPLDVVFFSQADSSKAGDIWTMDKMIDPQKNELKYVKKDTAAGKYVTDDWIRLLVNLYDGRAAISLPLVDLKNVFSINQFEYLRLGVGMQTRPELSNRFTFGGYVGYGFKDNQFKYGGNFGLFTGDTRNTLFSYTYKKDLLEPGRVRYLEQRPNYLRNFFAKEMDNMVLQNISFSSDIVPSFTIKIGLSSSQLEPNYDYEYLLRPPNENGNQVFNFTDLTAQFRLATPFSNNVNLRDLVIGDHISYPALYLTVTKGISGLLGGDFEYWRLAALFDSEFNFKSRATMDVAVEAGTMQLDMPYQVLFNGQGSAASLVSIIVKNSFQTLPLYKYASDRFLNTYLKYSFPPWRFKKRNFSPELALAANVGWGIMRGRQDIHVSDVVSVNEYGKGYYEIGGIIDNLLRIKLLNYLYGGLGIGLFYGYGADDDDSQFAVRVAYIIGSL